MGMDINGISNVTPKAVTSNEPSNIENTETLAKINSINKKSTDEGVTYEKGDKNEAGSYKINKMSKEDRAALVQQLKDNMEKQKQQMLELVNKTISGQVGTFGKANDDSFWRMLAGGNFKVDAATKAKAQADIGEDGYWGVKQTSQRLFDFASALAGDDVDKMKEMQKAMHKGFNLATKAWGKKLPDISQRTMDAADALFDNYYKSKETPEREVISE
ncbi:MAG: hypothetical protein K5883_01995 [Pseudobutyrivibrio sp.]|nr:hypothetical protein [Pseudobutyrivibrio sp.]